MPPLSAPAGPGEPWPCLVATASQKQDQDTCLNFQQNCLSLLVPLPVHKQLTCHMPCVPWPRGLASKFLEPSQLPGHQQHSCLSPPGCPTSPHAAPTSCPHASCHPVFQIKEQGPKGTKSSALGLTASKWRRWDSNPSEYDYHDLT